MATRLRLAGAMAGFCMVASALAQEPGHAEAVARMGEERRSHHAKQKEEGGMPDQRGTPGEIVEKQEAGAGKRQCSKQDCPESWAMPVH